LTSGGRTFIDDECSYDYAGGSVEEYTYSNRNAEEEDL